MLRTEWAEWKADSLWKKLWTAVKTRRLFAIRKSYVIDSEWFSGVSNSRFAIRNLRAGATGKRGFGPSLFEVPLRVLWPVFIAPRLRYNKNSTDINQYRQTTWINFRL
jgi:hypothetical protein